MVNSVSKEFEDILFIRLKEVDDLCKVGGQYHTKCMKKFYCYNPTNSRGKPVSENMTLLLQHIIQYILDNEENCQLFLREILKEFKGDISRISRIESSLRNYFEDDLVMYPVKNDLILCFRDSRYAILSES